MRFLTLLFTLSASNWLLAQIPSHDARNLHSNGTNTDFSAEVYRAWPPAGPLASWEKRKSDLRHQILLAAGLDPMPPRTPLNPRISGRIDGDGFTVDKVWLETMPGYFLAGNLYRPKGQRGPFPGIVSPHGHWTNGRAEQTELGNIPARAVSLAQHGFVVFNYDMVGYSDSKQTPHVFGNPTEQLWSFGPLGLQLWNSIRVVDFLESLPEVDKTKLGATGASGGGTQTFLLTAVDDRIRASAPVNMVSAIMQGGSPCENAPGLRVDTYNVEIASLMAPRPMLLVSATGDWTKNVPRDEFKRVQGIYEKYDHKSDVEVVQIDAPHNYNQASREAVYDFFARKLQGAQSGWKEGAIRKFELNELLIGSLPDGAIDYPRIFANWREQAAGQSEGMTTEALRDRLRRTIGAVWPEKVEAETAAGELIVMTRPDVGDRIPGRWFPGSGKAVLVVHPAGSAAAEQERFVQRLIAQGRSVLLIDAYQTAANRAPREEAGKYYSTFQRTDDARRVQDILTAMRWLQLAGYKDADLQGIDAGQIWAAFAAAVGPSLKTSLPKEYRGTDEDLLRDFFVPGIQRAGGVETLRRLLQ